MRSAGHARSGPGACCKHTFASRRPADGAFWSHCFCPLPFADRFRLQASRREIGADDSAAAPGLQKTSSRLAISVVVVNPARGGVFGHWRSCSGRRACVVRKQHTCLCNAETLFSGLINLVNGGPQNSQMPQVTVWPWVESKTVGENPAAAPAADIGHSVCIYTHPTCQGIQAAAKMASVKIVKKRPAGACLREITSCYNRVWTCGRQTLFQAYKHPNTHE